MDVTAATSTTAAAAAASAADNSKKQLSANFDTFLTLLTTQLKNQDPLSPMDSNQFTQQLVQFSQVEQQINSNKNLESLISLTKSQGAANAVSYLGKTITLTDGRAALQNGAAHWAYALPSDATSVKLVVTDSKGHAVYAGSGETASGLHAFNWDGTGNSGDALPPGVYKLSVTAQAADGTSLSSTVASQGVVSEVDLSGDEPMLMIGPLGVPLSKATLISGN
jgi:flagellar basal-body rod modification protein FlgD